MRTTFAGFLLITILALPAQAFVMFLVNDLGDASDSNPGDGFCRTAGNVCTVRAAIEEINALPDPHGFGFSVVGVVHPATPYPAIQKIIFIDGISVPGYSEAPLVTIDGQGLVATGLEFAPGSDDSIIEALKICGFTDAGVSIRSARVYIALSYFGPIGGGAPNRDGIHLQPTSDSAEIGGAGLYGYASNIVSGNTRNGIRVEGTNHVIGGNYVGLDSTGMTALPNGSDGIYIASNATGIHLAPDGSRDHGVPNIISGNGGNGVMIDGSSGNLIAGIIGVNRLQTMAVPNASDGVRFANGANNNYVAGADALTVIRGNSGNGVSIGPSCNGTIIGFSGNYPGFGCQILGNGASGISDSGANTIIRWNLICENLLDGIQLGSEASGTTILMNLIGVGFRGEAPNLRYGISVGSAKNVTVGGFGGNEGNIIASNGDDGINVAAASGLVIQNNFIGPHDSAGNVGNGIRLRGTTSAIINKNDIARNSRAGVLLDSGAANVTIIANVIDANGDLGIDLDGDGVTANDLGDADTGANGLQNFPVITSAVITASETIVQGTLDSLPNSTFALHFYRSGAADPSGFGEGATWLGTTSVSTNASGHASFSFAAAGTSSGVITATATGPSGTSEFSGAAAIVTAPAIQFSAATYSVFENDGIATVTVTRTGDLSATSTVDYATSNGTAMQPADYSQVSDTLTFAPGVASRTFTVPIVNDGISEPNETVNLTLSNPSAASLGAQSGAVLTISDASANLAITKTAQTTTFLPGQSITYTIAISNAGPASATNVTVTDVLPSGSTFVSAISSTFHCAGTSTITCSAPSLVNGATATITLTVTATGNQPITNSASVTADEPDPNGVNNAAAAAAIVPGVAIPTLTEAALIALVLMLAGIAAMKIR